VRTAFVACAQCGATSFEPLATGHDREYSNTTTATFTVVECVKCGLRCLNPRPDTSELDVIYPPNYHAYNIRDVSHARLPLVTRLRHRLYSRRFRRPLRYLRDRTSISLLDIGCGDGWMLDLYRLAAGRPVATYGVDFKSEACEAARASGHTVFTGRFEDIELPLRFDLANVSHVIEHVADPRALVEKAWQVLRPGGVLVIETPNTDTWDWRWFRSGAWGAYHIPRHWTFFDPTSLRRLGETVGFNFREICFHPAPVHWVWTCHNLAVAGHGRLASVGRRLFAPLDVFEGGAKAMALLAAFSMLDLGILAASGRTSNMMAIFQKGAD
jgi:SAM-dependent methyltransferase